MKKAWRIALFAIIGAVCLLMLLGYISTIVCGVKGFWISPVPIFETIFGLLISNLDMITFALPIFGICLMFLYIDVRSGSENGEKHGKTHV